MAPQLSEDEIDDLLYFSRAGEREDFEECLVSLVTRHNVPTAEILMAARDEGKSTCLHMAAGNGHLETVKFLLDQLSSRPGQVKEDDDAKKAFLDAPNEYGNTGLHWAAMNGHLAVVRLLVESAAAPALANDKNYVPLDLAGLNDKLDVVDYFLSVSGELETTNGEAGGLAEGVADLGDAEDEGQGEVDQEANG